MVGAHQRTRRIKISALFIADSKGRQTLITHKTNELLSMLEDDKHYKRKKKYSKIREHRSIWGELKS